MSNVPKLRFNGFTDEWGEFSLGEVIDIRSGSSPSNYNLDTIGKYPFLKVEDLNNCDKYQYTSRAFTYDEKGLIPKHSTIFPKRGAAILSNKSRINVVPVLMDSNLMAITSNGKVDSEYLYYTICRSQLSRIADLSGAIPQINNKHIIPFKALMPSTIEQQKIAAFLSAVDTKIEQLTQKEALLKQYKKGVMQKIFSQEIRFKADDGSEFPEWEIRKFGEVFERITTKNKENNQNVLTISAQQGLVNQEDYFNKSVAAQDVTGYYLLHKDDFVYNKSYSKGYPLGAIKRLNKYEKGVVSTLYICFRAKDCVTAFAEQFFENGGLNKEIHKIAQEGARNHGLLNMSVVEFFKDIELVLPCRAEQYKIAEFLAKIDLKIEQASKQLTFAKTFKKGLLQQMFV